MKDPLLALGLRATACAMKAKAGRLSDRDVIALMRDALAHAGGREDWREALLRFEADRHADPVGAGEVLHDWLIDHVEALRDGVVRLGSTLAGLEDVAVRHHPWMDRVDING